jgi:hypothetical protein
MQIYIVADIKGNRVPNKQYIKYRGFSTLDKAKKFYAKTTDFFGFGIIQVDMDEDKPTENSNVKFEEI